MKRRKKREDYSLSDDYLFKLKKYKGRPKAWDYAILKKAYAVVQNETLKEWERELGISPSEYYKLRRLVIEHLYNVAVGTTGGSTNIPKSYPPEAITKMRDELNALEWTTGLFMHEIKKAKQEGNLTFLNMVREVFGNDAKEFIDTKEAKGGKIKTKSIGRAYKVFQQWLKGQETWELPKTFYDREKPKGICLLAYCAHSLLFEPFYRTMTHYRAVVKMRLLAEKHHIRRDEVFGEGENTDAIFVNRVKHWKLLGIPAKGNIPKGDGHMPALIKAFNRRFEEVNEMLEALKDI